MIWTCGAHAIDLSVPRVMGIVNITPDSFSDGIATSRTEAAVSRARAHFNNGADILDLGAESTRPGCTPVSWQVEWARLEPVMRIVRRELPSAPLSVDTYHRETAERALGLGAAIINCVYGEPVPEMFALARQTGCGLVIPVPRTPLREAIPDDLRAQTLVDPMIGFGTTREQDLALLGGLRELARQAPVLVGVSRKRLIGAITRTASPADRLGGSVGAALWCAMNGASVVRVHDVKETRQALEVLRLLDAQLPEQGERPWTRPTCLV
ncbi:MAG: dihydropteroate synthase [Kiritimatiellia bacterium]